MLSQQDAISLLKKYETQLNEFQKCITSSYQHLLRCDAQMIPNILAALTSIAEGSEFKANVAASGMSSIKSLDDDPQVALEHLLVDDYLKKHFNAMCTHYLGNEPELLNNLLNFHAIICQEKIIFYKAKNGELAIKFPSQEWRDKFIEEMGGVSQFAPDDKFNPNKECPQTFPDNVTTLFISAYMAKNGELAIILPNEDIRNKFLTLLRHAPANTYSTYDGQSAIYFNDQQLHNAKHNFGINATASVSQIASVAKADVRYAARIIGQAQRDNINPAHFFATLPKEVTLKIASLSTDNNVLSEENAREVAVPNFTKPV